ncbi:MAG: hypothetical protein M0P69_18520 [Bacteroidales bacterium]|nr:hypothetical protein [Bacteroidales bacterium]
MVSINQVATGDVVKPASVVETMASAALGGVANSVVSSMFPGINPLFTSIGMIVGGVVAGSIVPGKAGDIVQNGLTITGAVKLSDFAMQAFGAMFGGAASAEPAETSAVIY